MLLLKQLACLLLSTCLFVATPAVAQSSAYQQAIGLFNSGQYRQALILFQQELTVNPRDLQTHYYAGVCFHCLGQVNQAAKEYDLIVAVSKDQELIKRSKAGLEVLSQSKPLPTAGVNTAGLVPEQKPLNLTSTNQTVAGQMVQQNNAPTNQDIMQTAMLHTDTVQQATTLSPDCEVIDLYTSWCTWCKKLEPLFADAASKYSGRLKFNRYDAETSRTGKLLAKKYKVRGFPTILFFDGAGNLVSRLEGAPQSMSDLEETIYTAYPALRPPASTEDGTLDSPKQSKSK